MSQQIDVFIVPPGDDENYLGRAILDQVPSGHRIVSVATMLASPGVCVTLVTELV